MPITDLGVSFRPGAQPSGGMGAPGKPKYPVQQAVQTLNMRLPKVFGARAPSPASLLTNAGGMGQWGQGGNLVAQVLALLAGVPNKNIAGLPTGSQGPQPDL